MSYRSSAATVDSMESVGTARTTPIKSRHDLRVIVTAFLVLFPLYFLTFGLVKHFLQPPNWMITQIVLVYGYLFCAVVFRLNRYPFLDEGVGLRNARAAVLPCLGIAAGGLAILVVLKLLILRVVPDFFPADAPFWDWSVATPATFYYPITVILQEYLAFVVFKGSIEKALGGDNANFLSLGLLVLLFGILHIAYGPVYMLASSLMMGLLGLLYCRQRSIWGLCIIHFVFGEAAPLLRFIA